LVTSSAILTPFGLLSSSIPGTKGKEQNFPWIPVSLWLSRLNPSLPRELEIKKASGDLAYNSPALGM
jgi:hypothetical protein